VRERGLTALHGEREQRFGSRRFRRRFSRRFRRRFNERVELLFLLRGCDPFNSTRTPAFLHHRRRNLRVVGRRADAQRLQLANRGVVRGVARRDVPLVVRRAPRV
tara:strand:- start:455 stop:769 length:315 start_codon:yes stop_codon:yes gene_type:complete